MVVMTDCVLWVIGRQLITARINGALLSYNRYLLKIDLVWLIVHVTLHWVVVSCVSGNLIRLCLTALTLSPNEVCQTNATSYACYNCKATKADSNNQSYGLISCGTLVSSGGTLVGSGGTLVGSGGTLVGSSSGETLVGSGGTLVSISGTHGSW